MISELKTYLGLPYAKDSGPAEVPHIRAAQDEGINCQALTHLVVPHFGIHLPPGVRSSEIFFNTEARPVDIDSEPLIGGDVVIFGRKKNDYDPRRHHLGIALGEFDQEGNPRIMHANGYDGEVGIWSLNQFPNYHGYADVKGVRRFKRT